jgi:hypothetical protein
MYIQWLKIQKNSKAVSYFTVSKASHRFQKSMIIGFKTNEKIEFVVRYRLEMEGL